MKNERGFTLVEVLVAAAFMILAMLAAIAMTLTAYGNLDRAREESVATALGQQRVEWLRNQDYAATALSAGTTTETLTGTYAGFQRETTIQDDTPQTGLKQIQVSTTGPGGMVAEVVALLADR